MNEAYVRDLKSTVDSLFEVADQLDEHGVGQSIEMAKENGGLRGAIRQDMLLFLAQILNDESFTKDDFIRFINDCLNEDYSVYYIRQIKNTVSEASLPQICMLLPYFIVIDKNLGGNRLSSIYIRTLSAVALGCIQNEGFSDIEEIVRYYRLSKGCSELVERTLGESMDFDPLKNVRCEYIDLIRYAIEVDKYIEKEDPLIERIEDAILDILDGERPVVTVGHSGYDGQPGTSAEESTEDDSGAPLLTITGLDEMVGLSGVKKQVQTLTNTLFVRRRCRQLSVKRETISMHMAFIGNPGTGKTTVARALGSAFREAGLLSKGHFTEVSRSDLVGKYVGHTASMVKEVFNRAKGGILFIDEAYSLTNEDEGGFGIEAVETLLKLMEDNRDDIAVIVAGPSALMQAFLDSNPGLRSRFPFVISFPDYTTNELVSIFKHFCDENDICVSRDLMLAVRKHFAAEASRKRTTFGNAREVRNYFEQALMNQADRLVRDGVMDKESLCRLCVEDLPKSRIMKEFCVNQPQFGVC